MRRIRSHLTYANVMVTILAFIVLSGGTAVALQGSNTVFSDDIANDNFNSPTQGQGGLVAADLRPSSVGSSEVANNSLTGADTALTHSRPQASNPSPVTTNDVSPKQITVDCPAGSKLTGGGYFVSVAEGSAAEITVTNSYALDANTWFVSAAEDDGTLVGAWQLRAVANCLNG